MTFKEARQQFFTEMLETHDCWDIDELEHKLGKTTIRCAWVDYVDYLIKDKHVSSKIATKWGQVI